MAPHPTLQGNRFLSLVPNHVGDQVSPPDIPDATLLHASLIVEIDYHMDPFPPCKTHLAGESQQA